VLLLLLLLHVGAVYASGTDSSCLLVYNLRLALLRSLQTEGFESFEHVVTVCAPQLPAINEHQSEAATATQRVQRYNHNPLGTDLVCAGV
jgi:hypothetical protein